jgi:general secretion pathway protein G
MSDAGRQSIARLRRCNGTSRAERGMTLLELVMVCAILLILASAALPIARVTAKRQQEEELRIDLREMRNAIDHYKDAADRNLFQTEVDTDGYPPTIDTLVEGVDITVAGAPAGSTPVGNDAMGNPASSFGATSSAPSAAASSASSAFGQASQSGQSGQANGAPASVTMHVRFLRKVPVDPMTGKAEWGYRSVQDDPDSDAWGGQDVFDVYSLSSNTALDGSKYSDW